MYKKIFTIIKSKLHLLWMMFFTLFTQRVWASDNPFPSITTTGDVVQTAGTHMETAFKYALVGGGGLLILICIAVLVHRLREDSREKDHGNLIMTLILVALGLTMGFVLIGIGWTAFSAQIQD